MDLGGIKPADSTVVGVVVEVISVVELGALVHQGRFRRRRGLVPLRRSVPIACRGEERGTASRGEAVGCTWRRWGLGSPPHRRRRPWLGPRRRRRQVVGANRCRRGRLKAVAVRKKAIHEDYAVGRKSGFRRYGRWPSAKCSVITLF